MTAAFSFANKMLALMVFLLAASASPAVSKTVPEDQAFCTGPPGSCRWTKGVALFQKRVQLQKLQQEETEHLDALKLEDEELQNRVQLQRAEDGEDEELNRNESPTVETAAPAVTAAPAAVVPATAALATAAPITAALATAAPATVATAPVAPASLAGAGTLCSEVSKQPIATEAECKAYCVASFTTFGCLGKKSKKRGCPYKAVAKDHLMPNCILVTKGAYAGNCAWNQHPDAGNNRRAAQEQVCAR